MSVQVKDVESKELIVAGDCASSSKDENEAWADVICSRRDELHPSSPPPSSAAASASVAATTVLSESQQQQQQQ